MAEKTTLLSPDQKKKSRRGFIREVKEEMRKVTWTTKSELALCTRIVVGVVFLFGLGIYIVDLTLRGCLHTLTVLFRLIFG